MKMIATWLVVISFVVFVIDWGIVGLKILDGNYDIMVGAYIGLISIVVFFIGVLCLKFNNRCQNCEKIIQFSWKYCPHCGKEIKKTR